MLVVATASAFAATAVVVARARPAGRSMSAMPVLTVGLGSALLAATSSGAPTGLVVPDVLARGVLALAMVLLGSKASSAAVLIGSVVAMGASVGSGLGWASFAIFGALAALMLARVPWPTLELVCVAGLVQVALRFESPATLGSAMFATLILVPLAASGLVHLGAPVRRKAIHATSAVGALALVSTAPWVVTLLIAQPSLSQGDRAATDALEAARKGDIRRASSHFLTASKAFSEAERLVGSWWTRPARVVPIVGRNATAVEAMARAGTRLTTTAAATAHTIDPSGIRLEAGVVPLHRIRALDPPLQRSRGALVAAERLLRKTSTPWLIPPVGGRLAGAMRTVASARRDTTNVLAMVRVVPAILGGEGPRRYFLAMQTPSEARATGGLMGNFGEITADGGKLQLVRVGRSADLNAAGDPSQRRLAAPPDYIRRYAGFHPEAEWRNVNLSPHFPSVAAVIGALYPQSGGQPIDGVISVDPLGLAALLKVVGPVPVAGLDQPLTAKNAGEILLFQQYLRFEADNEERVEFLGEAAAAVWARMTAGGLPSPASLANVLSPAFDAKHFLFASRHPEEQRLFETLDVDGGLPPVRDDSLAVVTQNAGGNKIDWFLQRSVRYRVQVNPETRLLTARLDLRLVNAAPSTGLPPIVIHATKPGIPPGENRTYLSVFTPWALDSATVDHKPILMESGLERQRRVYSAFVSIPPEGAVEVSLALSGHLPRRQYSLDVFKQTTVRPDDFTLEVGLAPGWHVSGLDELDKRDDRRATRRERLTADLQVRLIPKRDRWWSIDAL